MRKSGIKILLSIIAVIIIGSKVYADGYRIQLKIKGIRDTAIILAYYSGDKQYVKDTIRINKKGIGIIEGEEKLHGGIYLVVFPNMNYFEMLISDEQNFSVETDTSDLLNSMKFTGSPENESFYQYQRYMKNQRDRSNELQKRLKENKDNADSAKIIKEQLKQLDKEVKETMKKIVKDNPNTFLGNFINALIRPEIPEFEIDENVSNKDSLKWIYGFRYNKEHYLDNIDFSDERLLRTPIFHNKINDYFTKNLYQIPDSIMPEVEKVIEKARANEEVFKYVLNYLLNHFLSSKIMGLDEVFVNIAEKYYLSGQATWVDSTSLSKISEKVMKLKPNLIGNIAPDLLMATSTGEYAYLHQVNAKYTILYFWEPNCGHCKEETPKLHKIYENFKDKGVEVFAVYTQYKKEEWLNYINEHGLNWINTFDPYHSTNFRNLYDVYSTPVMYVLNEKKEIIVKRISTESLEKMLNKYLNE